MSGDRVTLQQAVDSCQAATFARAERFGPGAVRVADRVVMHESTWRSLLASVRGHETPSQVLDQTPGAYRLMLVPIWLDNNALPGRFMWEWHRRAEGVA